MKKDYLEACMNSTRQRILQTILIKKTATPAEIGEELPDIPRATLYRHIKVLVDAEIITVVKEESKRGSVEKTYAVAEQAPYGDSNDDFDRLIQNVLVGIQGEFLRYFRSEDPDPYRDMLTVGSVSLMLTDDEMKEFISEYGQLISKHMSNRPEEGRKVRKFTFISSPND